MPVVVNTREGYAAQLAALLDGATYWVHLFTNAPTLSAATVKADLTEAGYPGYAPQHLRHWTPPALRGGVAFSQPDLARFAWTAGPAVAVTGFFVTMGEGGPLVAAWMRSGGPFVLGPDSPLLLVGATLTFPPVAPL